MNICKKFFGHLKTVNKHRREVRKLCFKCGLYWQGLTHDLSKYSFTEFWRGVRFYTGKVSPHEGEREKFGYSKAWLHHKARNKHHREYWQDRVREKMILVQMPVKYIVEMFCDRVAACKIYLKDKYTDASPWEYYESRNNHSQFEESTAIYLEFLLKTLAEKGEKYAFDLIKKQLKGVK